MPHLQLHAGLAQPMQPGAQQRRRLHLGRKHAARAADKRVDAQPMNPRAQRIGVEAIDDGRKLLAARAIAPQKRIQRFGMRDVHPANARQQELAPG